MIPPYLLNANGTFYVETNPAGSFGQPTKVLTNIGTARLRADLKSETRIVRDGDFEQRQRVLHIVVNECPPDITTKTWVEIVSDFNDFTLLCQVESVMYSGLGKNHAEMMVVEQPPMGIQIEGLMSSKTSGMEVI